MLVQPGLCRICTNTTLLVFQRGGSILPVYSAAVVAVTAKWFCINFGTNVANPDVRIPSEAPANIVKRKGWFRIRAQITLGNSLMGSRVAVTALDCFWLPLCICETRVSRIVLAAEKVIIYNLIERFWLLNCKSDQRSSVSLTSASKSRIIKA